MTGKVNRYLHFVATLALAVTALLLLAVWQNAQPAKAATGNSPAHLPLPRAFSRVQTCTAISTLDLGGPLSGTVGRDYPFVAAVGPPTTTLPVTYTWLASDQGAVATTTNALSHTVIFTWTTPGVKAITVTAANCGGVVSRTHTITLEQEIYLPLVMRSWPPPVWHSECADCPAFIYDTTPRSIVVDSAGYSHVAYGGDRLYHAWRDGSGWHVETVDAGPRVGAWASLALDTSDHLHISYYDSENKDLKYAHWDGATWITETVDTLGGWDTAIALDSAGHSHIAYRHATLSDMSLKYAARNGTAWQITTVESGISGASDRDTSIALDGSDRPHIGYALSHHGSDPSELVHAWLSGTLWLSETVETVDYIGSNSMALSATGNPQFAYAVIVGSDYQLRYAGWNGTAWQIDTLATSADSIDGLSLALDGSSAPRLSYYSRADEAVRYAHRGGGGWQFETVTNGLHAVDWGGDVTSLALNAAGQPRISYFINRHNHLMFASPGSGGWQIETVEQGGDAGKHASLVLDGNGHPHISYIDEGQGSVRYAVWDGGQWAVQAVFQMDYQDINDWVNGLGSSSLALDSASLPHIVSNYDGAFGLKELRYATWDGSVWHTQVIERETASPTGVEAGATLALDGGDRPHIFYPTSDAHRYATWDGSQWQIETVDGAVGGGNFETPLVLDTAGRPHVAYFDAGNSDLKYAYRDGAGWHVTTVESAGDVGAYPSLALDAAGRPHLSYCRVASGQCVELRYARWDGTQWQIESVDATTGNVGYYTSLALDAAGHPHISYHDSDADTLKYACYDGAAWRIETLETGNVGWYTSLALDGSGYPHIAHYDANLMDLRYTWWGP